MSQLSYDSKTHAYYLSKSAINKSTTEFPKSSSPSGSLTVGSTTGPKAQFSAKLPTNIDQGITTYDNTSNLSFTMIPQFSAMAGKQVDGHLVYPMSLGANSPKDIYTIKGNGVQEDVVYTKSPTSGIVTLSYKLKLPSSLQARMMANGDLGIYSANPALFGNISYGSPSDQLKVAKARQDSQKTNLVFAIPAPTLMTADGILPNPTATNSNNSTNSTASNSTTNQPTHTVSTNNSSSPKVKLSFKNNVLTVIASNLSSIHGQFSIDPSVVVTSINSFASGNNEGDIAFSSTNNNISTGGLTGGSLSAGWTGTTSLPTTIVNATSIVYNGYIYEIGGYGQSNVSYAPINANGGLGAWVATTSLYGISEYATSVVYNGYVYEIGGYTGSVLISNVYYAPINANGGLGAWVATTSLPLATNSATSVVYNGYIYEMGGATSTPSTYNMTGSTQTYVVPAGVTSINVWLYGGAGGDGGSPNGTFSVGGTGGVTMGILSVTPGESLTVVVGGGGGNGAVNVGGAGGYGGGGAGGVYGGGTFPYGGGGGGGASQILNGATELAIAAGGGGAGGEALSTMVGGNGGGTIGNTGGVSGYGDVAGTGGTQSTGGTGGVSAGGSNGSNGNSLVGGNGGANYNYAGGGGGGGGYYGGGGGSSGVNSFGAGGGGGSSLVPGGGSTTVNLNYGINGYINITPIYGSIYYAPINANGSLGAWAATKSLVNSTMSATSVVSNGKIYEIGGSNSSVVTASVYYTPIDSVGAISNWTATTSLPTAVDQATSIAYNNYVYEIGGNTSTAQGTAQATVYYAQINNDGTLGSWTATTSLPQALYASNSVVYNNYLYVISGYSTSTQPNVVYYAPINSNGTLGSWTATTSLPQALNSATSVVYNDYVYEIGGNNGVGGIVSTVYYAQINSNGSLGSWTATTSLPVAIENSTSVVYAGFVYEIGGYTGGGLTSAVYYAQINSNGSLGSWITTTNLPNATDLTTSVVYNGYIYNIGSGNVAVPQTYGYTGGSQTYTVPIGVTSINVTLYGGAGGCGSSTSGCNIAGGLGGETTGTLSVTPGEVLNVIVGGGGSGGGGGYSASGGYGGGGAGGMGGTGSGGGGGGGGASQILNGTQELAVGAGGGGGGGTASGSYGQAGGGTIAQGYGNEGTGSFAGSSLNGGPGTSAAGGGGSGYAGGSGGTYSYEGGNGGSALIPNGGTTTAGVESGNGQVIITPVIAAVNYAPINSNGSLGSWITSTSLLSNTYSATSIVYNGYVYEIGGYITNIGITSTVDVAQINNGGSGILSSWTATTSLPAANFWATSVVYNGYVYEMGGTTVNGTAGEIATVDYATINSNGTLGSWTATTSLPAATYGATSVAYNGYVYEIGGYDAAGGGGVTTTVDYAPINSNGTLGSWTATSSLPVGLDYATSVAYNGYVYEIGGYGPTAVVDYASLQSIPRIGQYSKILDLTDNYSNGTVDGWSTTTSLPGAVWYATSVAYNSYLYEIGGVIGGGASTSVTYAAINSNGTLGTWSATTALPVATEYATSIVNNGYVYEIGGLGSSAVATVYYAPINSNGTLGAWTTTASLLNATYSATSVVNNGYVYEIGGYIPGTGYSSIVDYAPINSNGTLGSWVATTSLPTATFRATSVVYNNYVYEIGGYTGSGGTGIGYSSIVDYAPINSNGTLGSWVATTSLPTATAIATSIVYNGYVYEIGGMNSSNALLDTVDYAPINSNGTLGSWSLTAALPSTTYSATSVVYNNYVYEIGGQNSGGITATIDYTLISSNDPTPYELLTNGTNTGNPGIGSYGGPGTGGIAVSYSFASNSCSTLSSPNTIAPGLSSSLGKAYKFTFSTNGCSTATNIGRYVWIHYTLDDSQTATFPDINSNHTTINNFTVYYHPASTNRLRGGATFSNGSLQTLDTPP